MLESPLKILLVEDNAQDAKLINYELRRGGLNFESSVVQTEVEFRDELAKGPDVVLCDWNLPQFDSYRALEVLQEVNRDIPFILVSGSIGEEAAVSIIKKGAFDYLLKDRLGRLVPSVKHALATHALKKEAERASAALRQAELLFRSTFEQAAVGLAHVSLSGNWIKVNDRLLEITGYSREEMMQFNFRDITHPDDLEEDMKQVCAIREGKVKSAQIEKRYIRKDGTHIWVNRTGSLQRSESGEPLYMISVIEDINRRKAVEIALRETAEQFRVTFEQAAVGITHVSPEGRWLRVNQRFCEITDYSREELLQKNFQEITHPEDLPVDLSRGRQLLAGEIANYQLEKRYVRKNGSCTWVNTTVSLRRSEEGEPLYFITVVEDITQRKKTEAALIQSEARLSEAQEMARIGSWHYDPLKDEITEFSDVMFELYGLDDLSKCTMETLLDSVHPEDRTRMRQSLQKLHEGLDEIVEDVRLVHPDGNQLWVQYHARAIRDKDGKLIRIEGVDQDITERKLAEDALRKSEKRFRELADAIPQIVWEARSDGAVNSFNKRAEEYFGLKSSELLGWAWTNLVHPDDRSRTLELWQQTIHSVTPQDLEFRLLRKDKLYRWHIARQVPIHDNYGQIEGWYGTCTDIEDLKQALNELREERDRFLKIARSVPGALVSFRISQEGKASLPYVSPGFENIFGLSHDQVKDNADPFFAIFHPNDLEWIPESLTKSSRTLTPWFGQFRANNPKRGEIWVESRSMPTLQEDGSTLWHGVVTDITERKQAEVEQQKLISLIQHSKEFISIADLNGKITFINAGGRRMVGLGEHDDISNLHFSDYLDPPWREFMRQTVIPTALENGLWEGEMQMKNLHTGASIDVFRSIFLIRDATGRPGWYANVTVNITDRKRSERLIRDSEEKYRRLVDVLPDALFTHSNGKINFCNPAFVKLMGAQNEDQLLGVDPLSIVHTEHRDLISHRISLMRNTGESLNGIEIRIVRRDGRSVLVHSVGSPLPDPVNDSYVVALTDLSERERTLDLLHSVQMSVSDAIITIDAWGTIHTVNASFTRLFGYGQQEVIGKHLREFIPEALEAEIFTLDGRPPRTEKSLGVNRELQAHRKDGLQFPVEITLTHFQLDGELHFTCVIRDISSRKRLEEQFQQAQKMEAVGRLAGGIAHDFNNLLTVINGFSEILLEEYPGSSMGREPLAAIRDAGERAAGLTAQLLAFSRKAIIEPKILDLNQVVDSVSRLLRRLIGEDIRLESHLDSKTSLVKIDPGQLEQVLMNLAVNARDAMPEGGRLTIETAHLEIEDSAFNLAMECPPGSYVQLSVSDTGVGMSDEVKKRIFEPFFTTKGLGKGTGLGLAMVYGIIHQAGGAIEVESKVGFGTQFKILFPRISKTDSQENSVDNHGVPRGQETILLAEDEEAVRRLTTTALSMLGYKILQADSGRTAIEMAESYPGTIDLLLTDVVMPELGGRMLADAVRKLRPNVRVLYMSGYMDDAVVRQGIETSKDAFIQKPLTQSTLAKKVRLVLDAES